MQNQRNVVFDRCSFLFGRTLAFISWINQFVLQCNELNRGHPTFFYQSQDEFRTKESEFVNFGPIANEGVAVKNSFPLTKRQLNIYWKAPRRTLGGPGRVRYTVMLRKHAILCTKVRCKTSTYKKNSSNVSKSLGPWWCWKNMSCTKVKLPHDHLRDKYFFPQSNSLLDKPNRNYFLQKIRTHLRT